MWGMSDTTIAPGGTPSPTGGPGWATLSFPVAGIDPITASPVSIDPGMPVGPTPTPGTPGTTIYMSRSNHGAAAANVLGLAMTAGEAPGRAQVKAAGPLTLTTAQWAARTGEAGGLTQGAAYYLSATAGLITKTIPLVGFVTNIGFAIDANTLMI